MKVILEPEFLQTLKEQLQTITDVQAVTGPGRSGAIAAVYASYFLHIPFIPYGQPFPGKLLLIDTVSQSGKTMRKAQSRLEKRGNEVVAVTVYSQQERLHFWYEQL